MTSQPPNFPHTFSPFKSNKRDVKCYCGKLEHANPLVYPGKASKQGKQGQLELLVLVNGQKRIALNDTSSSKKLVVESLVSREQWNNQKDVGISCG